MNNEDQNVSTFSMDEEERSLAESIENDEWVPVDNVIEARERSIEYAAATLKKNRRMNIRVSERDVLQLKARAAEEGIPYETLVSMILHKYVTGRLVERTRR
jgi:predicted DNA binding CopG/RHH family protein